MNSFPAWNAALLAHFFSPASVGTEVQLATDPDELDIIGHRIGGDEAFVKVVMDGPPWQTIRGGSGTFGFGHSSDFFDRCLELVRQRRDISRRPPGYLDPGTLDGHLEGLNAPTYLPFLAATVRTTAVMGADGFYEQLATDFGIDGLNSGSVQMGQLVDEAWKDLEEWSELNAGVLGVFHVRAIGGFRLIGVPKSQIILTRQDHERLPRLFAGLGWAPGGGISETQIRDLVAAADGFGFMSTGFRDACADSNGAYADSIWTQLAEALRDWDGSLPEVERVGGGGGHAVGQAALGLLLQSSAEGAYFWEVAPMVSRDGANVVEHLRWEDYEFPAFDGNADWQIGTDTDGVGARLLAEASIDRQLIEARRAASDDGELHVNSYHLERGSVRYFVRDQHSPLPRDSQALLVERQGPPATASFFILSRADVGPDTVRLALSNNGVPCSELPPDGLPEGWRLRRVDDASSLGQAREELPGPWQGQTPRPRRARLVGGIRVLRGGSWYFLAYALPALEVDAPEIAIPRAEGLDLVQVVGADTEVTAEAGSLLGSAARIRRYDIDQHSEGTRQYKIVLSTSEGEQLESLTLRVLDEDTLPRTAGQVFRVGPLGAPVRAGEFGMAGATMNFHGEIQLPSQPFSLSSPGRLADTEDLEEVAGSLVGLFLDTLARRGSMTTSRAKDALRILAASNDISKPGAPDAILRSLWIAGLIEIESDGKGRWIKVHAVPASLYTVPVATPEGGQVACAAGTFRRSQWRKLAPGSGARHRVWISQGGPEGPPVVRVSGSFDADLVQLTRENGLGLVPRAAARAAEWIGNLSDAEQEWQEGGRESAPKGFLENPEVFWEHVGYFGASPSPFDTGTRLLRGIDPDTGSSRLHVISLRDGDGPWKYSFVRDQWWGRWSALHACAESMARMQGNADLSPWPIHYSASTGSVWLPGRLALPTVLARVLVMCSGSLPVAHRVVGRSSAGHVDVLSRQGICLVRASIVYGHMVPLSPRESTWLEYRWVPEPIARAVVQKVGAQLV